MKKKELIRQIAKNQGNSILETQYWTNIVLEELKKALIDDGEVDLYGFGKFTRVKRKGRSFYHDVRSGKMIDQPMVDALQIKFIPSKYIHAAVKDQLTSEQFEKRMEEIRAFNRGEETNIRCVTHGRPVMKDEKAEKAEAVEEDAAEETN